MITVYLHAVELLAPGLPGFAASRAVLAGTAPYQPQPLPPFTSLLLPANERRRLTPAIRLALQAAESVLAGRAAATYGTVFASSCGDGETIDRICQALCLPGRPVSPTQFHNSVHNAPAGYWSIAARCRQPSVSISAHDGTFAAGLLDAAVTAVTEARPMLLIAYEQPLSALLLPARPVQAAVAVALALAATPEPGALARVTLCLSEAAEDRLAIAGLEQLRLGNPAARALPLLAALVGGQRRVRLPYLDDCRLECVLDDGA